MAERPLVDKSWLCWRGLAGCPAGRLPLCSYRHCALCYAGGASGASRSLQSESAGTRLPCGKQRVNGALPAGLPIGGKTNTCVKSILALPLASRRPGLKLLLPNCTSVMEPARRRRKQAACNRADGQTCSDPSGKAPTLANLDKVGRPCALLTAAMVSAEKSLWGTTVWPASRLIFYTGIYTVTFASKSPFF